MSREERRAAPAFGEREAVALFARHFGRAPAGVRVGIGDDAAVLESPRGRLVLTVDACVEGTHFERSWLELGDIGWKAFHAAASDLGAMGAKPHAALSALELPRRFDRSELTALVRGQAAAARALGCPIVGGNVARAERLALTTTLIGAAEKPLTRSGARAGDELWLVGEVGLAALGLRLLSGRISGRKRPPAALRRAGERALAAWRRPVALVGRGRALVGRASAAVDVSDGLAGDARHLAEASRVRVVIEAPRLSRALSPDLLALARAYDLAPLELALYGGEDYALVATGSTARRPRFARAIGRVERGQGAWLETDHDGLRPLGAGFDHFD
jgi:thiamine-monophosphate kinase